MQLLLKSALPSCAAADSGRLSSADAPGVNAVYTPPASARAAIIRAAAPARRRARLGADLRRRNTRKRRPAGVSEVMGSVLWGSTSSGVRPWERAGRQPTVIAA